MYSLTRCVTSQQAAITRGISPVVSITKSTEIPVDPDLVLKLEQPGPLLDELESRVRRIESRRAGTARHRGGQRGVRARCAWR